jgi:FkbM family methyltransferase
MFSKMKSVFHRTMARLERVGGQQQIHRCKVKTHIILLEVQSEIERYRARTYSTKEPETLEWIERYFRPGDVFYDVGANIGLYSLFAAKHLGGQCKIYAFEPEALNYAQLSKNIFLNRLSGVIIPCCVALTDTVSFDTLYLNPDNFQSLAGGQLVAGSSLHSFGVPKDYANRPFQPFHQQGVVGVSIDHLWQGWGLDFPNHIKVDVDGLEGLIFAGAGQSLADKRLRSVLVEISAQMGGTDPITQSLSQNGFKQVTDFAAHSSEQLKGTPFEDSANCVFIREQYLAG